MLFPIRLEYKKKNDCFWKDEESAGFPVSDEGLPRRPLSPGRRSERPRKKRPPPPMGTMRGRKIDQRMRTRKKGPRRPSQQRRRQDYDVDDEDDEYFEYEDEEYVDDDDDDDVTSDHKYSRRYSAGKGRNFFLRHTLLIRILRLVSPAKGRTIAGDTLPTTATPVTAARSASGSGGDGDGGSTTTTRSRGATWWAPGGSAPGSGQGPDPDQVQGSELDSPGGIPATSGWDTSGPDLSSGEENPSTKIELLFIKTVAPPTSVSVIDVVVPTV